MLSHSRKLISSIRRGSFDLLGAVLAAVLLTSGAAHADTLKQITSASAQAGTDSLSWSQKGADGTVLAVNFSATTAKSNSVTVGLGAANSIISKVCSASPCSWIGSGFAAGDSLLWTSDAGNGGSGPVTISFSKKVAGAGALIQADLPGAFTAQIQVFNGSTSLGSFTAKSDSGGDPVYLGVLDQTGANISRIVYSLTTCASLCTDFGLDTVGVNSAAAKPTVSFSPTSLTFASTKVGSTTGAQMVTVKNTSTTTMTISSETFTGSNASSFLKSATTCGSTLPGGASCTISVEFKPTVGGSLTASLAVADNASGSPQTVALKGTATAPTATLSPTALSFSSTSVGSTTGAQVVTVKNTSTITMTISSETFSGTNASSFLKSATTCGSTLGAGASCTISVEFKPTAKGSLSAALALADNASGSPQHVALSGTGK